MSTGPIDKLPTFRGRRDGGLARVRDLLAIVRYVKDLPARPGRGVRFSPSTDGPVIHARVSRAVEDSPRRWVPYLSGGSWYLRVGKVWDAGTEITLTGTATALTTAAGGEVWLEVAGLPSSSAWTAAVDSGTMGDVYEDNSAGEMTVYRKLLGTFEATDPGAAGLEMVAGSLWYRPVVADGDLFAEGTIFAATGGIATVGMVLAQA